MAKLGDIATIQSGGTPARSIAEYWEDGTIPWVKISDIKSKHLNQTEEMITEVGLENSSAKIFPKGTILYTIFATLGETSILDINAATNQAIAGISITDSRVLPDYLYYYLLSQKIHVQKIGRGVAQNNINMKLLRDFDVPLPSKEAQLNIIEQLNRVTELLFLRKQQLTKLDELIKARFVEMFGDMLLNSLEWPEKPLEGLADIVSGITKGRKTTETGLIEVPYMAVSNVKSGYIDWTTIKTILATKQEIEQYRLMPDDILMTEGGDPDKVGRGAIIKNPLKDSIHQNHIFRVRLDKSELLPAYFAEYLQHQKAKRYFLGCAKQTTGIASINMRQLRALPVLIPPLPLQNQFADFVAKVDKSKLFVGSAVAHKPFDIEFFSKSTVQRPIKEV